MCSSSVSSKLVLYLWTLTDAVFQDAACSSRCRTPRTPWVSSSSRVGRSWSLGAPWTSPMSALPLSLCWLSKPPFYASCLPKFVWVMLSGSVESITYVDMGWSGGFNPPPPPSEAYIRKGEEGWRELVWKNKQKKRTKDISNDTNLSANLPLYRRKWKSVPKSVQYLMINRRNFFLSNYLWSLYSIAALRFSHFVVFFLWITHSMFVTVFRQLFRIAGVSRVFYGRDFITVSKVGLAVVFPVARLFLSPSLAHL